jgi:hypothetical protein
LYIKNPPYVDKNRDDVMATPVGNIATTKALLENNRSPTAVETVVKLMTKALAQQERANLVPPPKPGEVRMMALDLITSLVSTLQRSDREKLVTRPTLSQYPPMTSRMEKGHRETHHLLTRTTPHLAPS